MRSFLLACLLLFSCASRGAAACDPSTISDLLYYTDADSSVVEDEYGSSAQGYDFHTGRLFGHCDVHSRCFEVIKVGGSDAYRIQGAPAGVPIPIHVELRIYMMAARTGAYAGCGGTCSMHFGGLLASMYGPQDAADSLSDCFCGETTRSIGLDLVVMPDEDFNVRYFVDERVGADGFPDIGRVEANIRFTGVPPSAQLVSCHGVNDEAVLAKPSTWGRVKATYR